MLMLFLSKHTCTHRKTIVHKNSLIHLSIFMGHSKKKVFSLNRKTVELWEVVT